MGALVIGPRVGGRMRRGRLGMLAAISILVIAPAGANAQTVRTMEPSAGTAAVGETVRLRLSDSRTGAVPWTEAPVEHFFARTSWTQHNRDEVQAAGEGPEALWPADRPGVLMLGCDLEPREERVTAQAFAAFAERVLPASRARALQTAEAAGEVLLRRAESSKALVRVIGQGAADAASIATSKSGQRVEIRPLMDPTAIEPGSDLAVRVYAQIPGPDDGVVIATNTTTGQVLRAPTNDTSLAVVPIAAPGRWVLEFHAISPDGGGWLVHSATLSFDVGDVAPADAPAEEMQ